MSFSQNWEQRYSENLQMSRWPWSDLVALYFRFVPRNIQPRILELGAGSGANIPFLASLKTEFFANDGSPTIIQNLKERFPEHAQNFKVCDFTKDFGVEGTFDVIFDRASLTHNALCDLRPTILQIARSLKPNGIFLGIHWFSDQNTYATRGESVKGEERTRAGFKEGPFKGIEPVHFFSEEEIRILFEPFEILYFEHLKREQLDPMDRTVHSYWNFVVRKRE